MVLALDINFTTLFPKMLLRNICNYIPERETARMHTVCKDWKDLWSNDGHLNLSKTSITGDDLFRIIQVYTKLCPLETLNLSLCRNIRDVDLAHLSKLSLKKLDLASLMISDKGLQFLTKMPLKILNLSMCALIKDEGFQHLAPLPLNQLDLSFCSITDIGLGHLAKAKPPLKQLDLSFCRGITDREFENIGKLSLQKLDVQSCNLSDKSLEYLALAQSPVEVLNLNFCSEISDQGIAFLTRAKIPLKQLSLVGCTKITDLTLENIALAELGLEQIDLYNCNRITSVCLDHLAKLPLKMVTLPDCAHEGECIDRQAKKRNLPLVSYLSPHSLGKFLEPESIKAMGAMIQQGGDGEKLQILFKNWLARYCTQFMNETVSLRNLFYSLIFPSAIERQKTLIQVAEKISLSAHKQMALLKKINRQIAGIREKTQELAQMTATLGTPLRTKALMFHQYGETRRKQMVNEIAVLERLIQED